MRTVLKVTAACLVGFVALLVFASFAFADDAAPAVPSNPNPAALVAWCTAAVVAMHALTSALRDDNPALPFGVSAKARGYLLIGLGVGEGFALAVTQSTPWPMAFAIGLGSALSAFATHGVRTTPGATAAQAIAEKSHRPPPGPGAAGFVDTSLLVRLGAVAIFFVSSALACGLVGVASAAEVLAKCESDVAREHPGLSLTAFVAQSLASCGPDGGVLVTDVLEAILASHDPALAQFQNEARATRHDPARLGAMRSAVRHP